MTENMTENPIVTLLNEPKEDPTALTIKALEREILHLRELIEARLDNMDSTAIATQGSNQKALDAASVSATTAINAAQVASTTAINAALSAQDKAIQELDASIARRIEAVLEITNAKFVTYGNLLDAQKNQVNLSLDSSDKALTKTEQYNNQLFKSMGEKIDDLKQYQFSSIGRGVGKDQLWGYTVGAVGFMATVLAIVLAISRTT